MKTSAEDPYHDGARHWQDRFDSWRPADRLAQKDAATAQRPM